MREISRKERVRCPMCGAASSLGEWNDLTYEACTNREMRRAFMELKNPAAFKESSNKFYRCPKCLKWSSGCSLRIIDTEDSFLKSLGGKLNLKIIKRENVEQNLDNQ